MSFTDLYEGVAIHEPKAAEKSHHILIYFLTGNPGLVWYYPDYFNAILSRSSSILQKRPDTALHIYCCTLAGFQTTGPINPAFVAKHGRGPYDVEQEIEYAEGALQSAHEDLEHYVGQSKSPPIKVVLIGHSLGTYNSLEILRRRQAASSPIDIIATILLCPTVMNLSSSRNGTSISAYLATFRYFAEFVSWVAKLLVLVPTTKPLSSILLSTDLHAIVGKVTGHPAEAVAVTTRFLRSPTGVLQALTLARHELRDISLDKWDDEIWGLSQDSRVKLYLYFCQEDGWISDKTRDLLITSKASTGKPGEEGRPSFHVDNSGVTHDFCVRHADVVADKTAEWLKEIVEVWWK